jgi:hypothetical protein
MVLAGDAKDLIGLVLLKSGAKITEKHLKTLKSWEMTESAVQNTVSTLVSTAL